jgi:hypothetical protein
MSGVMPYDCISLICEKAHRHWLSIRQTFISELNEYRSGVKPCASMSRIIYKQHQFNSDPEFQAVRAQQEEVQTWAASCADVLDDNAALKSLMKGATGTGT